MAELSTLEYARYHGLTTDYTLLSPFDSDCFSDSSSEYEFDAAQSNDLSFLETPQTPLLDERWHIDSGGAGFLRSVLSILEHSPVRDYPTRRTERRQLRMASPLLSTDPGLDLAKLFPKRGNQSLQTVSLCDFVQLQPSDEIPKAEGRLSWPASDPSLLGRVENSIQHERLGITFEASKILRSITEDNWSHLETPRSRQRVIDRMSSPLLPLSPPPSDLEPLHDAFDMPYTSTPIDPTSAELQEMNTKIEEECPSPATSDIIASFLPSSTRPSSPELELNGRSVPNSMFSASKRLRSEDSKIAGLLTPCEHQSSPFKKPKTVSFMKDLVQQIKRDEMEEPFDLLSDTDDDFQKFFDDVIDLAAPARPQVEHEQLQMGDATLRMMVPPVDFSLPPAPWTVFPGHGQGIHKCRNEVNAQPQLFISLKAGILSNERPWPFTDTTRLQWVPIPPDMATVSAHEDFDVEPLGAYLTQLRFDESPEPSIWKLEGLRILDPDEDDDDELEDMPSDINELGVEEIVSKRYNDIFLDKSRPSQVHKVVQATRDTLHENTSPYERPPSRRASAALPRTNFLSSNSTGTASDMFMQVQSGIPARAQPVTAECRSGHKQLEDVVRPLSVDQSATEKAVTIPTPELPSLVKSAAFVVSTSLLSQCSLMQSIRTLYPSADFVERDFSPPPILNQTKTYPFNQRVPQPINTVEADLLLSPSTGLVLTTIQKLKQRPLPGQSTSTSSHTILLTRLDHLSARYKRLIVLVSDPNTLPQPSTFDTTSTSALNDLTNFVASLEADVRIIYVPGAEKEVAAWVVATMARFANDSVKLLHVETMWERWLRDVGMDAFSAQAVLGTLKDSDERGFCGLSRFLAMDEEERVGMFASMMGGERILRRVSRVGDGSFS